MADQRVDTIKAALAWAYAGSMAILTAIAGQASAIEPDGLVWMLGFAGAIFGAAFFPSAQVSRTVAKIGLGWIIAGVLSTPIATSHLAPAFVNVHVAALWLGFAGPGAFMASTQANAIFSRFSNKERST